MNNTIEKIFARLAGNRKTTGIIFAVLALAVFGTAFAGKGALDRRNLQASVASGIEDPASTSSETNNIETVGAGTATGAESLGSSWSGKIISLGNIPIQPQREGTLVEWRVKIGQWVGAGQTLGKLSAPPATPELVAMLADKAEALARARAQAATAEIFTEKTTTQLRTLLTSFGSTPDQGAIIAQKQNLRALIDQVLTKHGQTIGNVTSPSSFQYGGLNRQYGQLDQSNQNAYELAFMRLAAALRDPTAFPFDSAREYFAAAVRLANTTPESSEIMSIKIMMREDQEKFLAMFAEITMKETEYKTMSQEINEKIADNERMLAMAVAEVKAAEAAYATVERSVSGSLFIVAPHSGTISTIMKNVGEFVGPGMPVASLNAGGEGERFIRFSIPSNVKLPPVGAMLSVVRPGFLQDVQKVKLVGIGASLDITGAYMADADFLKPTNWPVEASVRVLASRDSNYPIIKLSSVFWDADGTPNVWGVSSAGRIFAKKITIGRTFGASIEVYGGLKNGDRYIINPAPDLREDMPFNDTAKTATPKDATATAKSSGHENMPGM